MLFNQLGYYSLVFGLFFSIILIPVAYKDLRIKKTVKINVTKINVTNKNLNLTLRPYMVQKLVVCGVS